MQSSKVGKYEIWYENSEEFYELKKEIFGENIYYLEIDKADPTIVDLGAHIGMTTLYYKRLFPEAKVWAYEPQPNNFSLLKKNIEENQVNNVELIQAAVAPKTGLLRLNDPVGDNAWKSGMGIIPKGWKGIQTTREAQVTAVAISEVLNQRIDILKMDIEGMEYEVVRAAGIALRNAQHILIEVHPRAGHRLEEIEKILLQQGFRIGIHNDRSNLGKGLVQIHAVLK
ncbi:MAG: FkbM family methyltransferase [bacterium]